MINQSAYESGLFYFLKTITVTYTPWNLFPQGSRMEDKWKNVYLHRSP